MGLQRKVFFKHQQVCLRLYLCRKRGKRETDNLQNTI